MSDNFRNRLNEWYDKLLNFLDLQVGIDKEKTIKSIQDNRKVAGANAWLLMCSIMIASLGLDLNSPAVIIGAMLISPLMAPILGLGLAVGINDPDGLRISLKNFGFSIIIALGTSLLYFLLTPYGETTPEIMARTKPTFLDVLVAFFGGIAGIISGSRKDMSNALPGVAIATALMPPLCVTGFGLASFLENFDRQSLSITLNSFYLFFINSFFIAVATYIMVRAMRFPYKSYMNSEEKKVTSRNIAIFSLLMIIPSFFILRSVLSEIRLKDNVEKFMQDAFGDNQVYVDEYNTVQSKDNKKLIIKIYGTKAKFDTMHDLREKMDDHHLEDYSLEIIPSSELDLSKVSQLESQISSVGDVLEEQLEQIRKEESSKDSVIYSLTRIIDETGINGNVTKKVQSELKTLFPDLNEAAFAILEFNNLSDTTSYQEPVLFVKWERNKGAYEKKIETRKMKEFVAERTGIDNIEIRELK